MDTNVLSSIGLGSVILIMICMIPEYCRYGRRVIRTGKFD